MKRTFRTKEWFNENCKHNCYGYWFDGSNLCLPDKLYERYVGKEVDINIGDNNIVMYHGSILKEWMFEPLDIISPLKIEKPMISVRIKNTNWKKDLQEAAMNTINKKYDEGKELTPELFKKYLISEHSPIRAIDIRIDMNNIPYTSSVHLVRHIHQIPYVSTNRPDRTKKERSINDKVRHLSDTNIQGLLDMGRKRLCVGKVSKETYKIMLDIKLFLMNNEDKFMKVIGEMLVPNCVYRGGCPEFKTCNLYNKIEHFCFDDFSIGNRYKEYNTFIKE